MSDAREVTITVRGEHEERIAPEEAVAQIVVRAESADRRRSIELLSARSSPIGADLTARQAQGSVVGWSSDRIFVWAEERRSPEERHRTTVHHASIGFAAVFREPQALSVWLGDVAERDGVDVTATHWRLTPQTAQRVHADVSARAVQVAVARATAYAAAIGYSKVVPVEIADAGLLASAETAPPIVRAATSGGDPVGAVELRPERLTITAAVDARFVVS